MPGKQRNDRDDNEPCKNGGDGLRLDKWLWQARFFKTRGLAATIASKGKIRINRMLVTKPHYKVRPGDVLTFAQGHDIRVIRIIALGERRGPAPEARTLYEDIGEPSSAKSSSRRMSSRPSLSHHRRESPGGPRAVSIPGGRGDRPSIRR